MQQSELSDHQMAAHLRERQAEFVSRILYETPGGKRFTQDSPILTNV